jgi:hypothetical protein
MTPELRRKLLPLRRRPEAAARRSLLASLRGVDWTDGEKSPFRSISDAIHAVVDGILGDPRREEKVLDETWPDLVGPTLAAHCRPAGLKKGRLLVLVDHSTWMHLIAFEHKRAILKSITAKFPHLGVSEIHFRLG